MFWLNKVQLGVVQRTTFSEIYWEIRDFEAGFAADILYTKQIINDLTSRYKVNKIFHVGHSNGGVFNLQLAIHMPKVFSGIISHMGGLGFDMCYQLDFEKLTDDERNTPILLVTGEYDVHKPVCQQAQRLFINENFKQVDYIEFSNETHGYYNEHEIKMMEWIKNLL